MKHIILLIIFSLVPLWSNETQDKILVMKVPDYSLLYQVLWNEASITSTEELRVILDCVKNRINNEDFPSDLDSVLSQPFQFDNSQKEISVDFTKRIDSLWKLPKKYPYLYFRSSGYKKSGWMNLRKWIKHKQFKHEFS